MSSNQQLLRALPQVGEVMLLPALNALNDSVSREFLTQCVRDAIDEARQAVLHGDITDPAHLSSANIATRAAFLAGRANAERQVPVINGTGVILHTSLGRAVLAPAAWDFAARVADTYSMLEIERESGKRGDRDRLVNELLMTTTGAPAATVVNNNAAATMLILNELAFGKEVVISRAQQVEIGGSYRMPDVMLKSGCVMVEVGTTNRCYARDYESAITDQTACLLVVHTSNYAITGFTHQPTLAELADVARRHNLPLVYDLGAGSLVDLAPYGLRDEPLVGELLKQGADLVCFSGDKLLGGPQAGLCVGRADLIQRLKRNQMFRMLRCDKITLALLEATLRLYLNPDVAWREIPTLAAIRELADDVLVRAERLRQQLGALGHWQARIVDHEAYIGGGSLPTQRIASAALELTCTREGVDPSSAVESLARALRLGEPCVMGRVSEGRLLLDLRCIPERQLAGLASAITRACAHFSAD